MTLWLKQNTAVTVKMGPFLDDADGKTAETGLSIAQADIRLTKNGGAYAQTNNSAGATHDENGNYGVPLNTTDTNTLGTLRVSIAKSGALPVWQDFMVVPANVYDSLILGSASDYLEVDVIQWKGATAPAMTGDAYARLGAPIGASISADIQDVPTAAENAQSLLKYDMSTITGEAARSPINALRFLRNKWTVLAGTLSVKKEDDAAEAWSGSIGTTPGADPITSLDPG